MATYTLQAINEEPFVCGRVDLPVSDGARHPVLPLPFGKGAVSRFHISMHARTGQRESCIVFESTWHMHGV